MLEEMIGSRFGELVVVSELPDREEGSGCVRYLCRCDCGRAAIRVGAYLRSAKKAGVLSCCRTCLNELRSGQFLERMGHKKETFRQMWAELGDLYGADWEIGVTAELMDAAFAEFGFVPSDDGRLAVALADESTVKPRRAQRAAYIFPVRIGRDREARCVSCKRFAGRVRGCLQCVGVVCERCFRREAHCCPDDSEPYLALLAQKQRVLKAVVARAEKLQRLKRDQARPLAA